MAPKTRHSGSSVNQTRQTVKGTNFFRQDVKKIKRIKMLANGGKEVRDRDGRIIQAAEFQSKDVEPGRVQPDRRWFGNTRVISQNALTHFRDAVAARQANPYSVVLKQNKLPMSLLQETQKLSRPNLTTAEPFSDTFGPKAQRKRPRIDVGSFEELAHSGLTKLNPKLITILAAESVEGGDAEAEGSSIAEISYAHDQDLGMDEKNEVQRQHQDDSELRTAPLDYILAAGTSKRIWAELYKVIDSSDIILHVLDARDPLGTRCHSVENYLAKEKRSKKVIYILNKVDLIPGWAAARWVQYLSKTHPTIAFHASINNSFGKGSLIQLLRQFSNLMSDKKQISVGFVGYPNVGKSSIINTIKNKKVCNVAPIPGETKVWQYITLMRRIYLIDCPGIVPPSSRDTETQKVLKGVVRVEHLSAPGDSLPTLLERVRPEYMQRTYGIESWEDAEDFMTQLAKKRGKLGKGGEANLDTVAKVVLNDWIRGRIPYFVRPPGSDTATTETGSGGAVASAADGNVETLRQDEKAFGIGKVAGVIQPLHQIVSRTRFVEDDQDIGDDGEEWGGIAETISEAPEVVQNDLSNAEQNDLLGSDGYDEEAEEAEIGRGDLPELAWEDLIDEMPPTLKGKEGGSRVVEKTDEEQDERHSTKEPRMKTNKRKAENFFTHANIKNKNRDRKIPKPDGRKRR
ncbi:MAG: GTPase required for pre-60S ribosomal subunit nuclear export and maturation [Cyphobasidiales sp. Tagirdzhanova-0007]|nr:MAG: GTPase required for pre-60S ribosomal subunit nuclear export and maturation [Cyphobasidiales sp. Tagirdzhanova-0007]